MIGRKPEHRSNVPERQRERRGTESRPQATFSYYAAGRRPVDSRTPASKPNDARQNGAQLTRQVRGRLNQLPFWIFIIVAVVCAVKVLALDTTPKIVIVNATSASASYTRPLTDYASVASDALKATPFNRSKPTLDVEKVQTTLTQKFPELAGVTVSVPLIGNHPLVYIQPTQPSVVLESSAGIYALNAQGVALAKLTNLPSDGTPVIHDQLGSVSAIGVQALPSGTISFIRTVTYQLKAAKLAYTSFTLPKGSTYELDLSLTGKAYNVRFNLQGDVTAQSGGLIATLQKLGQTNPASYIDMRVPDRVYYK